MAQTVIPSGDPTAVVIYSHRVFWQGLRSATAAKLMSVGLNAADQTNFVQYFDEPTKGPGDKVVYTLYPNINGPGVKGDAPITGQEKKLNKFQDYITFDQLRQAILLVGRMSQQRVAVSERKVSKVVLTNWVKDMIDISLMNQLCGNTAQTELSYTGMQAPVAPDTLHHIYASSDHSTEATLDSSDIFTVDVLPKIIAKAQGGLPFPIKPVTIKGVEIAGVLFLTAQQVRDMKTNYGEGQWGAIYQAAIQGGQVTGNPIFTGAIGFKDNIVMHQETRCPWGDTTQNQIFDAETGEMIPAPTNLGLASSGVASNIGRAVFCGAQSAAFTTGAMSGPNGEPLKVSWTESLLDGNNQLQIIVAMMMGFHKTRFANQDFGTIVVSSWNAP